MDFFTHLTIGALLYIVSLKDVTFDYLVLAVFCSVMPDLDIFISPLKYVFKSDYLEHRAGSHSYITGIILTLIVALIFSSLTQLSFFTVWLIGSMFYGLHVSMDMLTTTKIPFLYPFSKKEVGFYVEKAGSQFTMLSSVFLFLISSFLFHNAAGIPVFLSLINFYFVFFIVYYAYRIMAKIRIASSLTSSHKYLPGVLPFYYYTYIKKIKDNQVTVRILKKFHFGKQKEIVNISTTLTDVEIGFYEKSMTVLNKKYYYAKWTAFPVFKRKKGIFSTRFFMLEPMMRSSSMYMQFDFDVDSQEQVGYRQLYGRIKE